MKRKTIDVGDVRLPITIAGRRTAIFGISGSGKSNTATAIIEQLIRAGEQVVIIDPKGEGYGLTHKPDGSPSDLNVTIFGEPRGHIEMITEEHGAPIADFVVDSGRSVVLSLLGFTTDQAERRFVSAFLKRLYRLKSKAERPTRTLVVIEEAHLFIPEMGGSGGGGKAGDRADLVGAITRLVRQGRSFGIGTLLIDQRPQDVSKRAISQCDTIIAHRLTHKRDRDALNDWFSDRGAEAKDVSGLSRLKPGEGYVWAPDSETFKLTTVQRRTTLDTGAAPDDESRPATLSTMSVDDLDALIHEFGDALVEAKANDPAELKREIVMLRRQLDRKPDAQKVAEPDPEMIAALIHQAEREIRRQYVEKLEHLQREATDIVIGVEALRERILGAKDIDPTWSDRPVVVSVLPKTAQDVMAAAGRPVVATAAWSPGSSSPMAALGKTGKLRMMVALVQHGDMSPGKLSLLTGIARNGGTFRTYLGALKTTGFAIVYPTGKLGATQAGIAAVGDYEPLPARGDELLDFWRERFGDSGRRTIFDALVNVWPRSMSRLTLSEVTGISRTGGTFRTYIGKMTTLGIIIRAGDNLRVSDDLFPERAKR